MRTSPVCLPILLFAFMGVHVHGAQEMSCDTCHETSVSSPPHRTLDCTSCHSNIDQVPHQDAPLEDLAGSAICSQCHDADTDIEQSIHANILECSNCHGEPHEVLPSAQLASPVSPFKQIQTCGECHDTEHLIDNFVRSVHGHALIVSGLVSAPSCSDCHGAHRTLAVHDPEATVSGKHVPQTCGNCHQLILDTWKDSAHGKR